MKYKFSYTNINGYGKYKFNYDCFGEIYKEKLFSNFIPPQHEALNNNKIFGFIPPLHTGTIENNIENIDLFDKNFFINKSFLFDIKPKISFVTINGFWDRFKISLSKQNELSFFLNDKNILNSFDYILNNKTKNLFILNNFNLSNSEKLISDIDYFFLLENYIKNLCLQAQLNYNINNKTIDFTRNINFLEKPELTEIYKINDILNNSNNKKDIFDNFLYNFLSELEIKDVNVLKDVVIQDLNKSFVLHQDIFLVLGNIVFESYILGEFILSQKIKEISLHENIFLEYLIFETYILEEFILFQEKKEISLHKNIFLEHKIKELFYNLINLYYRNRKIESYSKEINTIKLSKDFKRECIFGFSYTQFLREIKDVETENIIHKFLRENIYKDSNVLYHTKYLNKLFKDNNVLYNTKYLTKGFKDINMLYYTKYLIKTFKNMDILHTEQYPNRIGTKDSLIEFIYILIDKIPIKDILTEFIYLFSDKTSIKGISIDKIKKIASKENSREIYIYNKYNNLSSNQIRDLIFVFDICFDKNINIDTVIESLKLLSKGYKNIDILKSLFLDGKQKQIHLNNEHELKLWKRFWFLYAEGETDKKILPSIDFPYDEKPINFEGFEDLIPENWNVVYPEKFWLDIDHHPIPNGKYFATEEIPLAINVMVEIINILILLWYKFYSAFWGWTGTQAVLGITNSVFEWITLETSINQQEDKDSRIHYERCYRWLRWESEKVSLLARNDMDLRGNYYVGLLLEEMINYMLDHHFDIIPIFEDVNKMDEWRSLFERDLQNDIPFILDKVKGIRHKLLVGKGEKYNV